ncbi:carotenoid oxygenase family protein [Inquilinus limosus]|uniref:carotenoid oxygenase family protein n=1 Tax=Inquilinus limosus TaxID=171674 RepID=UPI003F15F5EC
MSHAFAAPSSSFLVGNFRPVQEEATAEDLPIHGRLPEKLDGFYLRLGPNPRFEPVPPYHWVDGDGMLHAIEMKAGAIGASATYRNRYVRTAAWKADMAAGRAIRRGLRHPPDIDALKRGVGPYRSTANATLLFHYGRAFALCEFGEPHGIALPGLKTIGPIGLGTQPDAAFTAHPKIDPKTGELLYIRYRLARYPYASYGILDGRGNPIQETEVATDRPCMMHDFAVSSAHMVLLEQPLHFDIARAAGARRISPPLYRHLRLGQL